MCNVIYSICFLEPECKDPEQISQEKCVLVEDSTGKNINSLETDGFTVEETSLPVAEVTFKPEESVAREIGNDESKDVCDVTVAEDHVEAKVNGDFVAEGYVEAMEQNDVEASEDAVPEDHVEVMEHNTEVKVIGNINEKDRESETVAYNMDDVD